jgi:hypothetical protein
MNPRKSARPANLGNSLNSMRFLALFCAISEGACFALCSLIFVPLFSVPSPQSPVPKNTKINKKLEFFYYICYNIIEEL